MYIVLEVLGMLKLSRKRQTLHCITALTWNPAQWLTGDKKALKTYMFARQHNTQSTAKWNRSGFPRPKTNQRDVSGTSEATPRVVYLCASRSAVRADFE